MSWRQDLTRRVRWTKDGRLVYDDYVELDPVLKDIDEQIHNLVIGACTLTRDHELAVLCGAWVNRKSTLEKEL